MRKLRILFFSLFIFSINIGTLQAQSNQIISDEDRLQQEMEAQRAEYQELVKKLGAEDLLEDPEIKNMIGTGTVNFDKLENTIRSIQKKQANQVFRKVDKPGISQLLKGDAGSQISNILQPIQRIPDEKLKQSIVNNLKEGTFKRFLKNSPKLQSFLVNMLKSKKALPELARILDDKNKLYVFGFINIMLFVFLKLRKMMIKRSQSKSKYFKKSLGDSFVGWMIGFFVVFSMRIGLFIYFYSREASPAWNVFKETFL